MTEKDLGARYDLHSHTLFSDGVLVPAEHVRRAQMTGYAGLAITDHCDYTNVEHLVKNLLAVKEQERDGIDVYVGAELTHVPPAKIDALAVKAKKLGAEFVVVHGETLVEPVEEGTNHAAVESEHVDVLAHPGLLSPEDAAIAAENGVALELSTRAGHCLANGHVASLARKAGALLLLNTDAHGPGDFVGQGQAYRVARGAGLTEKEAAKVVCDNPREFLKRLG